MLMLHLAGKNLEIGGMRNINNGRRAKLYGNFLNRRLHRAICVAWRSSARVIALFASSTAVFRRGRLP
jgi:hypothetical protein